MAKSIKEVGKKVESKLSSEIAKKESEELKEALTSIPTGARVRVLKNEDGIKKYITSLPIEDYDKSDPYAWIKRRFAKRYGGGEYILEFISSDGELIKVSNPIYIEMDEQPEKVLLKEEEEFLRKMDEALKKKEEAVEYKAKIEQEKAKLETEKAKTVLELAEKQIDMITKLYEERIKMLEEKFKKSDDTEISLLLMELNRLKEDYMMAIQNIERSIEKVKEEKQPQYIDMIMQFMLKSMEKDSFQEIMKMITLMKELSPKEDKKKDFFEELLENPQKMELFKKIMGLDNVNDIKNQIAELFHYAFEREQQKEPKKDIIDEALESFEKMNKLKQIIQPVLGINPQPAKSFVELIATILQSPQVPQVVNAIVEGMTRARITEKMIEQGYIPAELAGHFVKPGEMGYNGAKPQKAQKQQVAKNQPSEEDMIKGAIIKSIQEISTKIKPETTEEEFAKMLAERLIKLGEANKMLAASIIFMDKDKRKNTFVKIMTEIMPDMPKEQAENIYRILEEEIENYIKQHL